MQGEYFSFSLYDTHEAWIVLINDLKSFFHENLTR